MSERQQSRPQTIWLRVACWVGNSPLVTALVNLAMRLRRMSSLLVVNGFWSTHSYHKEALFFTGHDSGIALEIIKLGDPRDRDRRAQEFVSQRVGAACCALQRQGRSRV